MPADRARPLVRTPRNPLAAVHAQRRLRSMWRAALVRFRNYLESDGFETAPDGATHDQH
jgi:hypothetical protein